ncbi:MAG: FG-GAP repeat domain-containing protein [bacterium]
MIYKSILFGAAGLFMIALQPEKLIGSELFRKYDLTFAGQLSGYHIEDLNNDALKDIILLLKSDESNQAEERRLAIYFQNENGFTALPSQTFTLSEDVILFDIGDVWGDLKKEVVFFTSGTISYYVLNDSGFTLSPIKLHETQSLFMLADKNTLVNWNFVTDLNGDYADDIFVPKITTCDVLVRQKPGGWLKNELPLITETHLRGVYDNNFSIGRKMTATYATPFLLNEDFNGDGRMDLIGISKDGLSVFLQDEEGMFQKAGLFKTGLSCEEIWPGQKIHRTRWGDKSERSFLKRLTDFNNDGVLDALCINISTQKTVMNPKTHLQIHFGKRDETDSGFFISFDEKPDQIINPGGTLLVINVLDLNHDNRLDLVVPTVKVGFKNILSMLLTKSVTLKAETYLMDELGRYPEKPNSKTQMTVKFSFRGGANSPVYEIEDFNGDGHWDILSSLEEKRLVLFFGNGRGGFGQNINAKHNVLLPQNGEMVSAIRLNDDNKCDVIIRYDEDNAKHKELKNTLRILLAK